jgi:tetratricopeptide (TPR) repeat protein
MARMMNKLLALTMVCMGLAAAPALAQHEQHGGMAPKDIGTVSFDTSCAPATKTKFNEAVALLHSFWFAESRAIFEDVLKDDPNCAMSYWGIALTHWGNPFAGQRSPQTIANGKAAIDKGQAITTATAREKAYVDAVAILFSSNDVTNQRQRVLDYEKVMGRLSVANKGDVEARIFWALSVAQAASPTDKTYARNLQAAEMLEPLAKQMPKHPGIAHYIIHAYDVPVLAPKALPSARSYAGIAPVVPHALHMPSHTFTRVGYWKESVTSNVKSAEIAEKTNGIGEAMHARDYMTYAYLQMGMDSQAKENLEHAMRLGNMTGGAQGAAGAGPNMFALAAIPARYAMERQQWAEAAALQPRSTPGTPYTEAITHFVRAVGAARAGRPVEAAPDVAKLVALRDREIEMKDEYWASQVDIQRRGAEAWVMFAQGRKEPAIAAMRETADMEDLTDKSAVTPGPIAPAREMLGTMLLENGQPKEALVEFEAVMKKEPNRFLAIYGAGKAAEAAKQTAKAKGYFKQLVEMCKDAGMERPELQYARKMAN